MGEHDGMPPDDGAEDLASVQRKAREIEQEGEATASTAASTSKARPAQGRRKPGAPASTPGDASATAPAGQPATTRRIGPWLVVEEGTPGKSAGVYYIAKDRDGNEKAPLWLCEPLHILAMTRDSRSADWGRLLHWKDGDGLPHRWAMPMELMAGDGIDVRKELVRLGLNIAPGRSARDHLNSYLQTWPVKERARCVDRLGWDGPVYVLPDEAIGADAETIVFQSPGAIDPEFSQAGTAQSWRDTVARLAEGNSRPMFAICCAFAAPMAAIVDEASGGFHLLGKSTDGKSTALWVAASVWGEPEVYVRQWRATANGLEGLAAMHNDGLLILDELKMCAPSAAGEAAYMLANGQGKTRAGRSGAARAAARWRLIFLSSGELNLSRLMLSAGLRADAGQEVRMADIRSDAGQGMGAFEVLNGCASAAALSQALRGAAKRHYGAVGVDWLRLLVRERERLADDGPTLMREFVDRHVRETDIGQVQRVARRFGLVAAAGELAIEHGLVGWPAGAAFDAVGKCFAAWRESFGEPDATKTIEERNLFSQVRAFFQVHGSARFEDIDAKGGYPVHNRAGFYRKAGDGERQFMVMTEPFRGELCEGFDARDAAKVLVAAGWLKPASDGKTSHSLRIPGVGGSEKARVYVFTSKVFTDDNGI